MVINVMRILLTKRREFSILLSVDDYLFNIKSDQEERKQMSKPNTLWKVVSILYIIFNIISGIVLVVALLGVGLLLGSAIGGVGVGITIALTIVSLAMVVLGIAAGIVGLKANVKAGKVLAIILVILAVISLIDAFVEGTSVLSAIIGLVLPVLYGFGVYKQINETSSEA